MDGTHAFTRSMSSRFVESLFAILTIITVCGRLSAVSGIELGIRFDAETRSYSVDVQIGDNVPEVWPDCSNSSDGDRDTLGRIRAVFRRASRKMHIATKHHAHIGEVRFLLPATWPRDRLFDRNDRGLSKVLQCKTPKDYLARPAIEVVHHELDKCTDAEVYEVRCGQQADGFMKLPLSSLAGCNYKQPGVHSKPDESQLSCPDPGRLLVHEFAHLQWGVFDEYDEQTRKPLCPVNRTAGSDSGEAGKRASLMASIGKDVIHFCDTNTSNPHLEHDPAADTRQNRECGKRSVWEVLRQHADFADFLPNRPAKTPRDLHPRFQYVIQCHSESTVFLVDQSQKTSAAFQRKARRAIRQHVEQRTSPYSSVSIVTYGGKANTETKPLPVVTDASGKQFLIERLAKLPRNSPSTTDAPNLDSAMAMACRQLQNIKSRLLGGPDHLISSLRHVIVYSESGQKVEYPSCSQDIPIQYIGSKCSVKTEESNSSVDGKPARRQHNTKCLKTPRRDLIGFFRNRSRSVFEGVLRPGKPFWGMINISSVIAAHRTTDLTYCFDIEVNNAFCPVPEGCDVMVDIEGAGNCSQNISMVGPKLEAKFQVLSPTREFTFKLTPYFQVESTMPVTVAVVPKRPWQRCYHPDRFAPPAQCRHH